MHDADPLGLWLHPHAPAAVSARRPRRVHWAYVHGTDAVDFERVADVTLGDEPQRLRGRKLERFGIVADPSRQSYGMGGPFLFYADFTRSCTACGEEFTFTARDQQFWYEELGSSSDSAAARCRRCRQDAKAQRRAQTAWEEARIAWLTTARCLESTLALASAGLALVRLGLGTARILSELVGALRRTRLTDDTAAEPLAWLARIELARGRHDNARAAAAEFFARTEGRDDGSISALRTALGADLAAADLDPADLIADARA